MMAAEDVKTIEATVEAEFSMSLEQVGLLLMTFDSCS
jgi:hypothetical protein